MTRARDVANVLSTATSLATDTETAAAISSHNSVTTSVHGITNTADLTTSSNTQTFTNKTFDGNNNTLKVKRGTTANIPGSPAIGDLYFDTTASTLKQYTSAGWLAVDSTTPRPPTIESVTQSGSSILVSFTPASTGPSATSYTATSGAISVTGSSSPITIPNSAGLTDNTSYSFTVYATNSSGNSASSSPSSNLNYLLPVFAGGNQSTTDLKTFTSSLIGYATASTPTAGGTLTVNSVSLGSYDYVIKRGNQTVSSFTNSDWFTATTDTRSAIIVVDGNLTINSGQTFRPSNRKLFTCIYVNGNLTVNGTISMTERGANHSGTGNSSGATTAAAIRLANGTFSSITNPQIPASGGNGASSITRTTVGTSQGGAGSAGTSGGTGGGGSGGVGILGDASGGGSNVSGTGSAGTSFSGGSGGGGCVGYSPNQTPGGNAVSNGGKGGDGAGSTYYRGGGVGNPKGASVISTSVNNFLATDGTAGSLVIYVSGTLSGSGSIQSNGQTHDRDGSGNGSVGGGCTGGGSVTVFYGTDSSSITPAANGGTGIDPGYGAGGNGGAGTARKLAL